MKRITNRLRLLGWELNRLFRKTTTVYTQQGIYTISLEKDNSIGKSLYCSGQYELAFMQNVIKLLRPAKATLLDIGANIGTTTIGMLKMGAFNRAIAIEPEENNYRLFQKNVIQNGLLGSVIGLPFAASDMRGRRFMELNPTNPGDHRVKVRASIDQEVYPVECNRVDDMLSVINTFYDISLVWVDVQGHEGYVFRGARKLIGTGVPVVSEIWPKGILESGMTEDEFCDIVKSYWYGYWRLIGSDFQFFSVVDIKHTFQDIGYDGKFENVIFTR